MLRIAFSLSHYSLMMLLEVVSFGIGRKATRACAYHSVWEEISFSSTIGLGIVAYLIGAIGLLHILYRGVVIGILVFLSLISTSVLIDAGKRLFSIWKDLRHKWAFVFAAVILTIALWPLLQLPLYPPTAWDALLYHLPIAKSDVQTHSLFFSPYIRHPAFPETNEMLFAFMLALYDDVAAQLVQFLMMLLIAAALLACGKRVFGWRTGIWAATLWLSNPFVLFMGSIAYVDIGMTLFICLGAYAFFNWVQTRSVPWLIISAMLWGFAAGSKYVALVPLVLLSAFLLYLCLKENRFRTLFVFFAVVALVAAPWYIRNFYYTGNPVWPYFGSIFGYGHWNAEDFKGLLQLQKTRYNPGSSLRLLLLLPWNLSFRLLKLFAVEAPTPFSSLYFFLLPVSVTFAIRNRYAFWVLASAAVYTLAWFYGFQLLRFLLPGTVLFGLVGMAGLEQLILQVPGVQRFSPIGITLVIAALVFLPGYRYSKRIQRESSVPVTSFQRDAYLQARLPGYDAYRLLNQKYNRSYAIYAPGDEKMTYYTEGLFMGDWFGPARCTSILAKLSDSRALYNTLQELHAGFFLINERDFRKPKSYGLPWGVEDEYFKTHFKLIWAAPYIELFEIKRDSVKSIVGGELITNSSLEEMEHEFPKFWNKRGAPLFDLSGSHSHTGKAAVELAGDDYLSQRIETKPLHIYRLSHWTMADKDNQSVRLKVNWVAANEDLVRADIEIVGSSRAWTSHRMSVIAPEGARWAEVYLQLQEGSSPAWFDDVSLREISYTQR